jgi:hypothetical protein
VPRLLAAERLLNQAAFASAPGTPSPKGVSAMKRFTVLLLPILAGFARAQEPEPPIESNTAALVVFGVLFVLFCIGLVWVIYRNEKKTRARITELSNDD